MQEVLGHMKKLVVLIPQYRELIGKLLSVKSFNQGYHNRLIEMDAEVAKNQSPGDDRESEFAAEILEMINECNDTKIGPHICETVTEMMACTKSLFESINTSHREWTDTSSELLRALERSAIPPRIRAQQDADEACAADTEAQNAVESIRKEMARIQENIDETVKKLSQSADFYNATKDSAETKMMSQMESDHWSIHQMVEAEKEACLRAQKTEADLLEKKGILKSVEKAEDEERLLRTAEKSKMYKKMAQITIGITIILGGGYSGQKYLSKTSPSPEEVPLSVPEEPPRKEETPKTTSSLSAQMKPEPPSITSTISLPPVFSTTVEKPMIITPSLPKSPYDLTELEKEISGITGGLMMNSHLVIHFDADLPKNILHELRKLKKEEEWEQLGADERSQILWNTLDVTSALNKMGRPKNLQEVAMAIVATMDVWNEERRIRGTTRK